MTASVNSKIQDPDKSPRKKRDRFNGVTEEELLQRGLPDLLRPNLDIVVIGINPGLVAAYHGHYYPGAGNHFWRCLYESGVVDKLHKPHEDTQLLDKGIGFTNACARTTPGSPDLSKDELREGCAILLQKIKTYQPKIAMFNGKLIYEMFSSQKKFPFGRQDGFIEGTQTVAFVMPSSSARCSQLPKASDKVPFYVGLRKLRDYYNGRLPSITDNEVCFRDVELKTATRSPEKCKSGDNEMPTDASPQKKAKPSTNDSVTKL